MFVAPTMVRMMIESPALDRYDLGSLKSVIYGGAPMLVEDLKKTMAKLGPCLIQLFGQGETPMTITYLPHRDHVLQGTPEQMKRLASAGVARTNVEVRIFDTKDKELPAGTVGVPGTAEGMSTQTPPTRSTALATPAASNSTYWLMGSPVRCVTARTVLAAPP